MDLSKRNRKVAISRWKKVIDKEKREISSDKKTTILKASICGFLAGDGSVQARDMGNYIKYQIDFFPDDEIMLERYMNDIKEVYDKTPSIKKRGKMFIVRISSKTIGEDILQETKFGLKTWKVPNKLFIYAEAKKSWLKAFFSAEGYVNQKSIKIQTVNKEGMLQVSRLLAHFSINHKFYSYLPKNKLHSKVYIIIIFRKEERKRFYDKIGFWHSKKMEILKRSISN
ncbi:MAG: hypothetical protein NTX24_03895 [Candidatus Pacearchaeota archaeon]|nr:hypothetical protein [Candidatus Pacearchaeota archaeon]